ncbi:MAG: hypothetical protein LBG13_01360 [Holosporales bacterium]|nr:hypothetical protein [Holosporales bacterium]
MLRKWAKTKGKQRFSEVDPGVGSGCFIPFFLMRQRWDKKFFLHKNKKVRYNIIDTCSCGLSFLGKLAGLIRRVLVYARETMRKISRNRSRRRHLDLLLHLKN